MSNSEATVKPVLRGLHRAEDLVGSVVLVLLALLPALEVIGRRIFQAGIHSSAQYVVHLVLWVTFVGGMITSREGRHLSLSVGLDRLQGPLVRGIRVAIGWISVTMATALTWSALAFLLLGFDPTKRIGVFPIQVAALIMPLGFAVMTARFVISAGPGTAARWIAATGLLAGSFLASESIANAAGALFGTAPEALWALVDFVYPVLAVLVWPGIPVLIVATLLGAPIFIVLGGIAILLFLGSGGVLAVIPNEAYTMLTGPAIPAIPLFTLAGFILSESKAGERLVRLFRAWFGRLPGGLAIMAILVCTFFTTFTGASGVTILALGALLAYILVESGRYSRDFSTGLLTASGSVGLLFPPSLPIILYGVTAQINILHMFVGGIVPGVLMVLTLVLIGMAATRRRKIEAIPFRLSEAGASSLESIWEILLPVLIVLGFFLGITTLVETGAVAVVYTLVVEVFIHRDLRLRDLPRVFLKCLPIVGGVLIILAVAKGLSYYIVDVEVPVRLTAWVREHIGSRYVFLLLLNLALLITGCLMDIFSAIVVVVPLIVPFSEVFGIHPVHLGIIFLANLELGYITPPVGLNLYLASYRFEQPLMTVYRNVVPFFAIRLVTVLLITYVPFFSLALLRLFGM